jgi:SPP1 gp7 family putative phage head morphogenesis protein
MPSLTDRFRLATRALMGTFSEGIGQQAMAMLSGIKPGGVGEPPRRGTRELLAAYSESPWLAAVARLIGNATAMTTWRLFVAAKPRERARRNVVVQRAIGTVRKALLAELAAKGELREIEDHLFLDLMATGNQYQTGYAMRKLTQVYIEAVGEAFWMKERNGVGAVAGAWPIPTDWVIALPTPTNRQYRVSFRGWQGWIPDTEILHFVDPDPSNPYGRGTSLFRALGDELQTDEAAAKTTLQWFGNRARPDILVTAPGATPADTRRFELDWMQKAQGFWKVFKPLFINRDVKIQTFDQDFRAQQFVQIRQHARDMILQARGISPEILGVLENSNRATIESADYLFQSKVIVPALELQRAVLQERLLPEYDDRLILDYVNPVQEDKAFALEVAKAAPWSLTVDEWRARQGLAPVEANGGQVYMIPFGVSPSPSFDLPEPPPPAPLPSLPPAEAPKARRRKALGDDPELPALARIAERLAPQLRAAFLGAVEAMRSEIDTAALATALAAGQTTLAETLAHLDVLGERLNGSVPILREGFLRGGQVAHADLKARGLTLRFDLINPHAAAWAAAHGADLVTQVTEATRAGLRTLIETAVREGASPYETAKQIRDQVGLLDRQQAAVDAKRAALEAAGVTGDTLEARVGRYAAAQLRQRAEVIARTETLTATNQGQQALWREAVGQGLLDRETTQRVWIATPDDRLDPECEALDGEAVGLDEAFSGGVMAPPAHPQCRCTTGLIFESVGAAA